MIVIKPVILVQIMKKCETKVPDKQIEDPFQIVYEDSEVIAKETKESDIKKQQIPDNEKRSEAFEKRSDEGREVPCDQAMDSEGLVTFAVCLLAFVKTYHFLDIFFGL